MHDMSRSCIWLLCPRRHNGRSATCRLNCVDPQVLTGWLDHWIMLDVSLSETLVNTVTLFYIAKSATEAIHLFVQPGTAGFSHSKFDLIMPYQHASFCGDVCNMLGVVVGRHRTASKKDSSRTWEKRCEDVVKLHFCISSSHFRSVWCWGMRSNVSKPACKSWGHALGDCHRQEAYIAVSLVEACCGHTHMRIRQWLVGSFDQ